MNFTVYIQCITEKGYHLECPLGCSAYGCLCNGDPMRTPCGRSLVVDENGNEIKNI